MSIINVLRIILILSVLIILILLIKLNKALKLEQRIGKYSIYPINNDNISIMDKLDTSYNNFSKKIAKKIKKNKIIKKYSEKYKVYSKDYNNINPIILVINKLTISLLFLLVIITSYTIQNKVLNILEFILYLIIGFYLYDIYLIINQKICKIKIKNNILKAVVIMNNAFKSGKSIMQATNIAATKLPYPMNKEFEKIYEDMLYGLSADVVFDRFQKRVDIEEARYISSALTIVNTTGGDIVEIFNSIENTLMDKKKLETELKNITAVSKLTVKVLIIIPFIFILIIHILDPNYFSPLLKTPLGNFIILIIAIMLSIFIYVLNKVTKINI